MAGACIGFLTQNRYKARVFMGDTGSLALGGGLAAMAACTGMFLPLFIASGIFIIETVSVILQVLCPSQHTTVSSLNWTVEMDSDDSACLYFTKVCPH